MRVTEVKVFPVTDDKLKAFVSVVLDNCFMVNDIKVIEGREGRFISMPSRRKRNGKFKDIAHPLNSDTRQMLESEILEEYERLLNGDAAGADKKSRPRRQANPREKVNPSESDGKPGPQSQREVSSKESTEVPAVLEVPETTRESSLEEVTEKHLSDSFWTS